MSVLVDQTLWRIALANATCSSIEFELISNVGHDNQTALPAAITVTADDQERSFMIPAESAIQTINGTDHVNLVLLMEPLLSLQNGTHSVTAALYSDETKTSVLSKGKLEGVSFTGCQALAVSVNSSTTATQTASIDTATETASLTSLAAEETQTQSPTSTDAASNATEVTTTASPMLSVDQARKKIVDSGISIAVLGFVFLVVVLTGLCYYRKLRAKQRRVARANGMWQQEMDEV